MEKGKFIIGHLISGDAEVMCKEAQAILRQANRSSDSFEPLFPSIHKDGKEHFYVSPLPHFYATVSIALGLLKRARDCTPTAEDKIFMGDEKIFRVDGLGSTTRKETEYHCSITSEWPASWGKILARNIEDRCDVYLEKGEFDFYARRRIILASGWTIPIGYRDWYAEYYKYKPKSDEHPIYGTLSDIFIFKEKKGSYEIVQSR